MPLKIMIEVIARDICLDERKMNRDGLRKRLG